MKTRVLALLGLCMAALAGCHSTSKTATEIADTRQAMLGSWTLRQANGLPDIPDNILLTLRPDSSHDKNRLGSSGFSGVNHFTGSATLVWEEGRLSFGNLATTRMMGPEPRMKFEQAFLKQMEGVVTFRLKDNQLILATLSGEQLTFARGTN